MTAERLQAVMTLAWLGSEHPLPQLRLAVQGGQGTGKTKTANLCKELVQLFLGPDATRQCAYMHSAARLVQGETLHGALAVPIGEMTASSKSLGRRKDELLHKWGKKVILFLDESSMGCQQSCWVAASSGHAK